MTLDSCVLEAPVEAPLADCLATASKDLCDDIAHHLNWLSERDPRAPFDFCMGVGLTLLNGCLSRGAVFDLVRNTGGLFEVTPSQ